MAALSRPTEATYAVHESVTVDTEDREDHTFCGIMFPVKARSILPVHRIIIDGIAVRGELGPITVWVTNDDDNLRIGRGDTSASSSSSSPPSRGRISMQRQCWTKIYERSHPPSWTSYTNLDLSSQPIVLRPGQVRGVYVHSSRSGDRAIVYDNRRDRVTHRDGFVQVLPGRAHVSGRPFGGTPVWGWGNAWRDDREFVGRIAYGAVYRLWDPREHMAFGSRFRDLVRTLFMCQRRCESPISLLPDDCVFFVLNMCRWDWAGDGPDGMEEGWRERRRERRGAAAAAAATSTATAGRGDEDDGGDAKVGAVSAGAAAARAPARTGSVDQQLMDFGDFSDGDNDEDMSAEDNDEDDDDDEDDNDDDYEDSDDGSEYEYENDGYRDIGPSPFYFRDYEEEDSDDGGGDDREERVDHGSWLRGRLSRIHVLRAFASVMDD